MTPEEKARESIDRMLASVGWLIQDRTEANIDAGRGVAIREFSLGHGFGEADYLLFVDGQAVGVIEAKREGSTLTGVEIQTQKYSEGIPEAIPAPRRPLPFCYQSTGIETRFTNLLEPHASSHSVFSFHTPTTLAQWLGDELANPGSIFKARLNSMPPLISLGLRPAQITAIDALEDSLRHGRRRSLIQMATGSGKNYTACNALYRLIKFAGARRILFLVDRGNLGRQTLKEFQAFRTPDDGRIFTELYNVQLLQSNRIDPVAKVCISTIQRLYSMLAGKELDAELDELSGSSLEMLQHPPEPIAYNPGIPIEMFDLIVTDECHRSIYNLWRQVLEYFDASLIGLTATPSKQTLGFFNQNLIMEYPFERAVADGVNVDFDLYTIRTLISEHGSVINAGYQVDYRDRATRKIRWELADQDIPYISDELDRKVVVPDQIRTIVRTFRDRLFTDIFPGRTEVPKTLIFAKDDSHADDIVQILREEFGKGNDFAQKITYRTGAAKVRTKKTDKDGNEYEVDEWVSSGIKPEDLLSQFRTAYNPRIAVTVDMIATGTDILIPRDLDWQSLERLDGDALDTHYRHILVELGKKPGMLGTIFRKAQNRIQDPAKLKRLISDLIGREQWTMLGVDVKGDAYEGLLEKNAADVKGGAGQYFTPRALIQAIVDVMRPEPGQFVNDPACGTGGFLLAVHDYISNNFTLDKDEKRFLKEQALTGTEIVDGTARLCAMNLFLHGIGGEEPVSVRDALSSKGSVEFDMVLTNPPFGKKSSITVIGEDGDEQRETLIIVRDDFWATTSNKQLNFVQHVRSVLKINGRAAVVVPDNVLFEGGAGELIRRRLLHDCDVHTLLRLPTGIFYAQGVKANVLFFDRRIASEKPWTEKLWIYDFRTNEHFTLKTNPLRRENLDDFVACYKAENRHKRKETERFHTFSYDELVKRDKASLDIFWLKDDSLEDAANLPAPDVIAAEIVEDLQAALDEFALIAEDLRKT